MGGLHEQLKHTEYYNEEPNNKADYYKNKPPGGLS